MKLVKPCLVWLASIVLLLSAQCALAQSSRNVVAISDLHVGAGRLANNAWNPIEDFRWEPDFKLFLKEIAKSGTPVDLVLTGDSFELWQSPTMQCSTKPAHPGCDIKDCKGANADFGCSESEAVERLRFVLDHHPEFVAALKGFVDGGKHRIFIVPGNHDAALTFPKVRQLLTSRLGSPNITVTENGYWLSDDGRIYADHGHQFDLVNRYPDWPAPFVSDGGVTRLPRPWGEHMVLRFYNQYEYLFPVVDNLSDEVAGIKFALANSTHLQTAGALAKFVEFLVIQQSLKQSITLLGGDDEVVRKPDWNYAEIRKRKAVFFIDVMKDDPDLYKQVATAVAADSSAFDAASLTDEQIDVICRKKAFLYKQGRYEGIVQCPQMKENLGAILNGVVQDDVKIRHYLQRVLPKAAGQRNYVASIYIYGHTHRAVPPSDPLLNIVSPFGVDPIEYVNTGAFQRLATPAQLSAIIATKSKSTPAGVPVTIEPDDLPACYNYVSVPAYADKPKSKLLKWYVAANGKFTVDEGECLK